MKLHAAGSAARTKAARTKEELKKELFWLLPTSRPRKVLFDHLPKTGGTTLTAYLQAHYLKRRTFSTEIWRDYFALVDKFRNFPQSKRYGYDFIIGHHTSQLIDFVHPECLKITILRDPVDRAISHYYYAKLNPGVYLYSKIHESDMSLEDYVTSCTREVRNFYTWHFSGLTEDEVEQHPEESINRAVETLLSRYDIIGFLDDLSSFVEKLRDQAGLRYEFPKKRLNVTRGRVSIDDVPESTIDVIKQTNRPDIVLYERIRDALGQRSNTSAS